MASFVLPHNRPKPEQIENGDFDVTALTSILTNCSEFTTDEHWKEISQLLRGIRNNVNHTQKRRLCAADAERYIEELITALEVLGEINVRIISFPIQC